MNTWEGQVLAIAVKELLEAAKTLGRDGFGFKKDKTLLSTVIRDLLSERPNIPSAQATLKKVESSGPQPGSDYYVARDLLAKVQRNSSSREPLAKRTLPPLPAGEGRGEGRVPSPSPSPSLLKSSDHPIPLIDHPITRSPDHPIPPRPPLPAGEGRGEGRVFSPSPRSSRSSPPPRSPDHPIPLIDHPITRSPDHPIPPRFRPRDN